MMPKLWNGMAFCKFTLPGHGIASAITLHFKDVFMQPHKLLHYKLRGRDASSWVLPLLAAA